MLSLSNNRIAELPALTLTKMPLLKSLNVNGNPLSKLPLTIGGLSKLDYLEFDASETLLSPPRDITGASARTTYACACGHGVGVCAPLGRALRVKPEIRWRPAKRLLDATKKTCLCLPR